MNKDKKTKLKAFGKKMITSFLAMVLTAGTFVPLSVATATEAHAAETTKFTTTLTSNYVRKIKTSSGTVKGFSGVCATPFSDARTSGDGSIYKISNNTRMARVAYYAEKNGLLNLTKKVSGNTKQGELWWRAIQYARYLDGYRTNASATKALNKMKSHGYSDASISLIKSYYNKAIKAVPSIPVKERFEIYFVDDSKSGKQDYLVWKLYTPGGAYLLKTSTDASYNASKAGIEYTVYKADKKTSVGVLKCNADGKTNTLSGLGPGTYYVKETKTNANYQLNSDWIPAVVKSSQTTKITAKDAPVTGKAKVIKVEKNGEMIEKGDEFTFKLVSKSTKKAYNLTVTGTGDAQASGEITVPAGEYDVTETSVSPEGKYENVTMNAVLTVPVNGTGEITWENVITNQDLLNIQKEVDDDGDLEGFTFRVTGELYNQGETTAEKILTAVDPKLTDVDENQYEIGDWEVNTEDVAALNEAAANRESGEKTVRITNTLKAKDQPSGQTAEEIVAAIDPQPTTDGTGTIAAGTVISSNGKLYKALANAEYAYAFTEEEPKEFDAEETAANIEALLEDDSVFEELPGGDANIEIEVKVNLQPVKYDAETNSYKDSVENQASKTVSESAYKLTYNDYDWNGSATMYKDIETGENFTILKTDSTGAGINESTGKRGIENGISSGKFTATEEMTEAQQARYRRFEPMVKEVTGENVSILFRAKNKARRAPIVLQKASDDGEIENIRFKLSGTAEDGTEVSESKLTGEDGKISFGEIPAGSYVIEETGWDKNEYENIYPLDGHDVPAIAFTLAIDDAGKSTLTIDGQDPIEGNATEPLVIPFNNERIRELKIAKVDGTSYSFLEDAEFELYEGSELAAKFQIVRNDDGSAGVNMLFSNGKIEGTMNKTIIDEEGEPAGDNETDDFIADDDGVTPADGDDQSGGSDSGEGDGQSDTPSGDQDQPSGGDQSGDTPSDEDLDSLNWATLKGLEDGKEYTLKEVKAPEGYLPAADVTFTYSENPVRIVVENFIPSIETVAKDSESGTHTANRDNSVTITDTVTYSHLEPGKEYTMKAELMAKNADEDGNEQAGTPVKIDGKPVTAEQKFTASETGAGTVEVTFPSFDATKLNAESVVAFETCFDADGEVVAEHRDINDDDQTVHFPEIKTEAKDPDSKTGLGTVKEKQTIIDTVTYKYLDEGEKYKMVATLYDKTTGKVLEETRTEQEFTAAAGGSGTVEVTFTVDSTKLIHHKVVAFEECYTTGEPAVLVGFHKDPDDPAQTIEYPNPKYDMYKIRITDASEKPNTGKYGFKPGDKVYYEVHVINQGNVPITADVSDKFNGDAAEYFSLPVVEKVENATQNSISEDKNSVNITFEKGETAVVTFSAVVQTGAKEYLAAKAKDSDSKDKKGKDTNLVNQANKTDDKDGYVNTAKVDNPTYPDPENPDNPLPVPDGPKTDISQTPVREPKIGTYLADNADRKDINPSGKTVLIDTVAYSGLTPGQKYAVVGTLMLKDKESELVEDGEPVQATGIFTAQNESGSVDVKFEVDTRGLKGKELVAFEVAYNITGTDIDRDSTVDEIEEQGIRVASHEDFNDASQTVRINTPGRNTPSTGDNTQIFLITFALLSSALAVAVIARRRMKRNISD